MVAKLVYILLINLITFGGGPVYIPMYQSFYSYFDIANIDEYYVIVSVMNAFPGVTGGKLQGYAMYVTSGPIGFILGSLCFIIPGFILMRVALNYYEKFKDSKYFEEVNRLTKPVIIGILISIGIQFTYRAYITLNLVSFVTFSVITLFLLKQKVAVYKIIYFVLIISISSYFLLYLI